MTLTDLSITFINGETESGAGFYNLPKVTQLAGAGIQTQTKGLQSQHLTHQVLRFMNLPSHSSSFLTKEKCGHWAGVTRGVVERVEFHRSRSRVRIPAAVGSGLSWVKGGNQ